MGNRKKSVQWLKEIIVTILLILLSACCIILSIRIEKLEQQIEEIKTDADKKLEIVWDDQVILGEKEQKNAEESSETEIAVEDDENTKKVYLTFDDGPSIYTEEILKILREYNVKATFFVSGENAEKYDGYLQKILDDGHSLGIHTYNHVYSEIYASLESFQNDFKRTSECIKQQTGEEVKLYRFPGGSGNTVVSYHDKMKMMEWLKQEDIVYFDWNVSSGDGGSAVLSPETLAKNCIEGVKAKDMAIVLLHDAGDKKNTVEALPFIIEGINQLGDTRLLPIDKETVTVQHMSLEKDGVK